MVDEVAAPTMDAPNIKAKKGEPFRLLQSLMLTEKHMRPFRERRYEFMREVAGPYYGKSVAEWKSKRPLNVLFSMAATMIPHLTWRKIKLLAKSGKHPQWFCDLFSRQVEKELESINAVVALRAAVQDALYGMGIVCVGLTNTDMSLARTGDDQNYDQGRAFVDHIDFDDYLPDTTVKIRSRMSYEGYRYRMRYETAMDCGMFQGKAREELTKLKDRGISVAKNMTADTLATGGNPIINGDDEFDPQIELAMIHLRRQNKLVCLPGDLANVQDYLCECDWTGDPDGPLKTMSFYPLNSNIMPVPLFATIWELYEGLNIVMRKAIRRAENTKDILGVERTASDKEKDAVRTAADGDMVDMENKDRYTMLSFGGKEERQFGTIEMIQQKFNQIAGNLDTLGGMSQQANTLGQEQMLFSNASVRVNDMQAEVTDCCKSVVDSVAAYVWSDTESSGTYDVGGLPHEWNPQKRVGQLEDYNLEIDPYAGKPQSPEQRYQTLLNLVTTVYIPSAQAMQAQGLTLDYRKLTGTLAKMLDTAEIADIITDMTPQQDAMGMPLSSPGQAGPSTSVTNNVSMGGRGRPQPMVPASPGGTNPAAGLSGV